MRKNINDVELDTLPVVHIDTTGPAKIRACRTLRKLALQMFLSKTREFL